MEIKSVSEVQIVDRLKFDNTWWSDGKIPRLYGQMQPRLYFDKLFKLVYHSKVRRAVIVMGPRRVGKTVMIYHQIDALIKNGVSPNCILYASLDTPIYTGQALESLINLYFKTKGIDARNEKCYIFFDEIQYLEDWEIHLKSLVDSYHNARFIASGSAAAALKLKSRESGAGRFTDFNLPPLTFHEYIHLRDLNDLIIQEDDTWNDKLVSKFATRDIQALNNEFVKYINYGGYPEVSLDEEIVEDPYRYLKDDIISKVLQRDLPSLYGIQDIKELNRLFMTIAWNTGNEFNYEGLSQNSGASINTIKKYVEYLETAFLIRLVYRIDDNGKRFKRQINFKIYLTNPSLRSGLFSPANDLDEKFGSLVETAIFSQWFNRPKQPLHYARWKSGEIDIVNLSRKDMKPTFAVEVKWSDRYGTNRSNLKSLLTFMGKHKLRRVLLTSKHITRVMSFEEGEIELMPAALYCYTVGRRSLEV
ncbi:MAG: ATP-binding protein [Bacteroidota bacterium]